jgi:hypothetical protein
VRTNSGDTANRTDVFAVATRSLAPLAPSASTARVARTAPAAFEPTAEFRQRVHENILRTLERRLPGSAARASGPPR